MCTLIGLNGGEFLNRNLRIREASRNKIGLLKFAKSLSVKLGLELFKNVSEVFNKVLLLHFRE